MKKQKKLSPQLKDRALAALTDGMSATAVSEKFGISTSYLYAWRKKRTVRTTVAAKAAAPAIGRAVKVYDAQGHAIRDATLLLRRAKATLIAGIRDGRVNDLESQDLLAMLALDCLQGGGS